MSERPVRDQQSGPSALRGLEWLARTGPAPVDAWAAAMGWGRRVSFRHAQQLERDGWISRQRMTWGEGSLLSVTAAGVQRSGLDVAVAPRPAPTWWAHLSACAWVAAWLTVRGREMQGPREIDADPSWRGELRWSDGKGQHKATHRPDLAWLFAGTRVAIEVELTRKSTARLEAVLDLHARWRATAATGGVAYVCRDQRGSERILQLAGGRGLTAEPGGGLRVETLETVKSQAVEAAAAA